MKPPAVRYVRTGEVRPPRADELFLFCGAIVQAREDVPEPRPIVIAVSQTESTEAPPAREEVA